MRLTGLPFEAFVEHAFGHEVRFHGNAWFFDVDSDFWDPGPAEALARLTRLFEDPVPALEWFSDRQIAQGLTYLVNTMASGDNGWFYAPEVPLAARLRAVESVGDLFEKLFLPRCAPLLGHRSEGEIGTLNSVCYMWWDTFPTIALAGDPHLPALHAAAFAVMERILHMDSPACQESALHGLGHWARYGGEEAVPRIIDGFLAARPDLDPRLAAYARSARSGCVL